MVADVGVCRRTGAAGSVFATTRTDGVVAFATRVAPSVRVRRSRRSCSAASSLARSYGDGLRAGFVVTDFAAADGASAAAPGVDAKTKAKPKPKPQPKTDVLTLVVLDLEAEIKRLTTARDELLKLANVAYRQLNP